MNIKEHIEAGHYPKDEKGRALVPMKDGRKAVICATDGPEGEELVGWHLHQPKPFERDAVCSWQENGCWAVKTCGLDLLPPPPRKVKRAAWVVFNQFGDPWGVRDSEIPALEAASAFNGHVALLTGEYEEPWA